MRGGRRLWLFRPHAEQMLRTGVRTLSMQPLRRGVTTTASAADKRKQRPISPHVQIFKFPLPAMVSIATRFTGVGLTAGVAATGVACLLGNPVREVGLVLREHVLTLHSPQAHLPLWIDSFKSAAPVLVPLAKGERATQQHVRVVAEHLTQRWWRSRLCSTRRLACATCTGTRQPRVSTSSLCTCPRTPSSAPR